MFVRAYKNAIAQRKSDRVKGVSEGTTVPQYSTNDKLIHHLSIDTLAVG